MLSTRAKTWKITVDLCLLFLLAQEQLSPGRKIGDSDPVIIWLRAQLWGLAEDDPSRKKIEAQIFMRKLDLDEQKKKEIAEVEIVKTSHRTARFQKVRF